MSSSKYANLPDIDTAQDVYETEDVPELGSRRGNFDDDDLSDSHSPPSPTTLSRHLNQEEDPNKGLIDETSLPNIDTLSKRFGALASQTYTLYPSSLPFIRPHLPSSSIPSEHQYPSPPDQTPEHPRARIRRLRYEMEELEKDLASSSSEVEGGVEEKEAEDLGGESSSTTRRPTKKAGGDIMKELRDLKGRLVALGGEAKKAENGGAGGGWEGKLKMLQEGRSNGEAVGGSTPKEEDGAVAVVASPGVSDERKVAELDKRLAELEGMIGVGNSGVDISDPLPTPLLPTLQKLDHLLTLLTQPRHLDAISRRVKLLLIDLDKAQQSSQSSSSSAAQKRRSITATGSSLDSSNPTQPSTNSGGSPSNLTPSQLSSLNTIFTLLPRLQPLLPLVPHVLARLRSLASLHASAGEFASTLSSVERESGSLKEGEKELRSVLERLEENLKKNERVMEGNLEGLGRRVDRLGERVEGLSS